MRLVVYPHDLSIGGSQINAIDLAAAAASAGHEVIVYGQPGPLVDYVREVGLEFIPAHSLKYRPAPSRMAQLAALARRRRIDLIHAYEWPPCLDAYYGPHIFGGVPLLCTVLSMEVSPLVPPAIPLIMGTRELAERAERGRKSKVWTLEPPIRSDRDTPDIDGAPFRSLYAVDDQILIVTVSRLATDLKLDALVRAIDAAGVLAERYPVRFVLVGDGPARAALQQRADNVNRRQGRHVVALHGPELDPRHCYAAADIVLGMGSSALRALSMEKPVVVQGEDAFSLIFEPSNYDTFLHQGFYGIGDPAGDAGKLALQLETLIRSPELRRGLGQYGRRCVTERFSLGRAAQIQLDIYAQVLASKRAEQSTITWKPLALAARIEFDNHWPAVKASRALRADVLMKAASQGHWPPQLTGPRQV